MEDKATGDSKFYDSLDKRSYNIGSKLPDTCVSHLIIHNNKLTKLRKNPDEFFVMTWQLVIVHVKVNVGVHRLRCFECPETWLWKRFILLPNNFLDPHSLLQHPQFGTHCQNPYVIMMIFQSSKVLYEDFFIQRTF